MTFETLLGLDSEQSFVSEIMGQTALFVSGRTEKFHDLPSWRTLNNVLQYGGLCHPRLRMITGKNELPAHVYSRNGFNGYPRLLVGELTNALRNGAVLAIESFEQLDKQVSEFCFMLEDRLDVPVQADLYASWRELTDSESSWNDHELLVLQLEGKKAWRLHSPTTRYPGIREAPPEPVEPPAWTGVLQTGDLLYVPRRWWFCDQAVDGPALYLGVKFKNPIVLDVVTHLINDLSTSARLGTDCPRFTGDDQSSFLRLIQAELTTAATKPGLLLGFLKEGRRMAEPRVRFALPWSAGTSMSPYSEEWRVVTLVRFLREDTVIRSDLEDAIEIVHDGKIVRLGTNVAKIFDYLCERQSPTVRTLMDDCANEIPPQQIADALWELTRHGIVSLQEVA